MARHGVLLVNLGTPDSPSTADVRRYLREFLSDPRVMDIPAVPRALLVRGVIVPLRGPGSAAKYRAIWRSSGSPLLEHGTRLRDRLQERLGAGCEVALAMRYGSPSLPDVLERLRRRSLAALTVIPLFPQYSSATVGSVHEAVLRVLGRWQTIPPLRLVSGFHAHPGFLQAWVERARAHDLRQFDHVLFSFHGLPHSQLRKADPGAWCLRSADCCAALTAANRHCYGAQCHDTARRLAAAMDLPGDRWSICFQSRMGRQPWTGPAASDVIRTLARGGCRRILVFSPSFVADCLETLHEIAVELAEEFRAAGGERLELAESLNSSVPWVEALADLATQC